MSGAPYQLDVSATDDETQEFSIEWTMDDGSPFPWSDYAVTYSVHRDGCLVWSWDFGLFGFDAAQILAQGAGIAIDTAQNLITFTLPQAVCAGRYDHGCRISHLVTGKVVQIFDGSLVVGEGNFA